jgi:hypothetical protein
VAGNVIPAPDALGVAAPTPMVVVKLGVVKVAIVPLVVGRVSTVEPDTAGACKVTLPLVSPATITLDILFNPLE